jgi:anti-sigma factor ChrR (cupin superfamily)
MSDDHFRAQALDYALGTLAPRATAAFEDHVLACADCAAEAAEMRAAVDALAELHTVPPPIALRDHVLEMAAAPRGAIDLTSYTWDEPIPGVKMHTLTEDHARGVRAVLVWAKPGARVPSHRHLGDEEILVLQGALSDHRGRYGPGDICRSRTGFVHSEVVLDEGDCVCFVVYHGGHEPAE